MDDDSLLHLPKLRADMLLMAAQGRSLDLPLGSTGAAPAAAAADSRLAAEGSGWAGGSSATEGSSKPWARLRYWGMR